MSSKNPFFVSSSAAYGWSAPSQEVKLEERNIDPKIAKFNKDFWRSTNEEYGVGTFRKRGLARAVDDLTKVVARRHLKASEPAPIVHRSRPFVESALNKASYSHTTKEENVIYTTSNNEIGKKTPNPLTDGPGRLYPNKNEFTKTFRGMYRNCGLTTTVTKPRYI